VDRGEGPRAEGDGTETAKHRLGGASPQDGAVRHLEVGRPPREATPEQLASGSTTDDPVAALEQQRRRADEAVAALEQQRRRADEAVAALEQQRRRADEAVAALEQQRRRADEALAAVEQSSEACSLTARALEATERGRIDAEGRARVAEDRAVLATRRRQRGGIRLGVYKTNEAAKQLYEQLGFTVEDETNTHWLMVRE